MSMYIVHMCYVCCMLLSWLLLCQLTNKFIFNHKMHNIIIMYYTTIYYAHTILSTVFYFFLSYYSIWNSKKYSIAVFDYPNFNINNFQLFQSNIVRYSFALILFIDRYLFIFFFHLYSSVCTVFILNKR